MTDLLFLFVSAGFLGLAITYTWACEKLRGDKQ